MIVSTPRLSEPIVIRPIKTTADYAATLAEIEQMMGNVAPDTPEGDKFDLLVNLVEAYENAHDPMGETSDPILLQNPAGSRPNPLIVLIRALSHALPTSQ